MHTTLMCMCMYVCVVVHVCECSHNIDVFDKQEGAQPTRVQPKEPKELSYSVATSITTLESVTEQHCPLLHISGTHNDK